MSDTWIVNLRHYLNEDGAIAITSGTGRRLAEHFAAIVQETSSDVDGEVAFPMFAAAGDHKEGFVMAQFRAMWTPTMTPSYGVVRYAVTMALSQTGRAHCGIFQK